MSVSTSTPRVQLLDPHTVNQIAAGEVVERPASVVKELVENAIDAGATRITVELLEAGTRLIRVSDDGRGMDLDDAQTALLRHATSKIRAVEDLQRVHTLGFRGEALPSIASVSKFLLSTGIEDGQRVVLEVEGGDRRPPRYEAGPRGTTIQVEDLFFNTPARLKFLKTAATELGQITEIVGKYAVCHPHVAIKLVHGSSVLLDSPGTGETIDALAAVWGWEVARALAPLDHWREGARVRGFISAPHFTKPTRSQQWIFVNGRPVRNRTLFAAIDTAYRQITPEKRYPVAMLMLDVDPGRVDMNVSPTKSECRFSQEGPIFDAIRTGIKEALLEHGMMPSLGSVLVANEALGQLSSGPVPPPQPHFLFTPRAPFGDAPSDAAQGAIESGGGATAGGPNAWSDRREGAFGGTGGVPATSREDATGAAPGATEGAGAVDPFGWKTRFADRFLSGLRVIGQTSDCFFIIAENDEGIMVIDQHVAHERILFERLRQSRGAVALERQALLTPLPLELDRRQAELARERLEAFRAMGFDLEPFGATSFLVRSAPAALRGADPVQTLRDVIDEVIDGGGSTGLSAREQLWVMASCKMAIKAGDRLGMPEMEKLLLDLAATENPYLCPHGRPITITMGKHELLRRFKRA